MSSYDVIRTSTENLSASESADLWSDHIRHNQGGLNSEFHRGGAFSGTTIVQRAGDFRLVEFESDEITYVRSEKQARLDDDRSVRLVMPRRGSVRIRSGAGNLFLRDGAAAIFSMSSDVSLSHPSSTRAWIFSLPESAWPNSSAFRGVRQLDTRAGITVVMSQTIRQLAAQRNALNASEFMLVASHIAHLAVASNAGLEKFPYQSIANSARDLVGLHADEADFTPRVLASMLGWSLRQVQLVLRSAGTSPSDLIRSTRLQNAKLRLASPAEKNTSITDIAHASGFGSVSGFHDAFRAEYGMSPREARPSKD